MLGKRHLRTWDKAPQADPGEVCKESILLHPKKPHSATPGAGEAGRWWPVATTHQETTGLGSPCTRMLMVTSWPSLTDWSISDT